MNYLPIALLMTVVAGCAGHPATEPAAMTGQTPRAVSGAEPVADDWKLDPKRVANAKRLGYTVINENGETMFCRTQSRTGSHLQQDTYCMTAADFDALRERTQQSLSNSSRTVPPPAGH